MDSGCFRRLAATNTDRLLKILSQSRFRDNPGSCLEDVLAHVSAYAAETEQADDRTQLVIRYNGDRGAQVT